MTLVSNYSLNRQAYVTICGIPATKNVQEIASHIAVFLPQGSFESPLCVSDGCEIPNMRPVLCNFHSPGKQNFSEFLGYLVPYVIKISVALWLYHRFPLVQHMGH
jgi:hypothetical protein